MSAVANHVVLAHPTGNQFFRHLARTLRDAGRLAELRTCIDWRQGTLLEKFLPATVGAQLARRSFSQELGVAVATHPWREAARLACGGLRWSGPVQHETGRFSVDAVYRDFDRWVARGLGQIQGGGVAYAYEDAAEATFQTATTLGWRKVYDLPIAYWQTSRRLLEEEAQRWPDWEPTLVGTRDSSEKLARKTRELELADVVVCPSDFVAQSLPAKAVAGKVVAVAPFGSPQTAGSFGPRIKKNDTKALRVLFAGSMTQRKGLADLFAALRLLARSDVELVVLGSPVAPLDFYRAQGVAFRHEAPRPHAEVLALMRTCDVLCLPSIVEGRALVVQEALSEGLPAIVTANTGAADVVGQQGAGWVVPMRNPEAIARQIAWCAEHKEELRPFSEAARMAAAHYTWSRYGTQVLYAIDAPLGRQAGLAP